MPLAPVCRENCPALAFFTNRGGGIREKWGDIDEYHAKNIKNGFQGRPQNRNTAIIPCRPIPVGCRSIWGCRWRSPHDDQARQHHNDGDGQADDGPEESVVTSGCLDVTAGHVGPEPVEGALVFRPMCVHAFLQTGQSLSDAVIICHISSVAPGGQACRGNGSGPAADLGNEGGDWGNVSPLVVDQSIMISHTMQGTGGVMACTTYPDYSHQRQAR